MRAPARLVPRSPVLRYILVGVLAFTLGSATIVQAAAILQVEVMNGATHPVPVQSAPIERYQVTKSYGGNFEGGIQSLDFDVPAGKILVVEYVSMSVAVGTGEDVSFDLRVNPFFDPVFIHASYERVQNQLLDLFVGSQPITLYVPAATPGIAAMHAVARRTGDDPVCCLSVFTVTVVGHLIAGS